MLCRKLTFGGEGWERVVREGVRWWGGRGLSSECSSSPKVLDAVELLKPLQPEAKEALVPLLKEVAHEEGKMVCPPPLQLPPSLPPPTPVPSSLFLAFSSAPPRRRHSHSSPPLALPPSHLYLNPPNSPSPASRPFTK